ncbi:MAG: hypothetical protein E7537_06505 [Ruminococcaceae bacterium]|nr:hypothetical protein [Oscillospiraceae bacterium]
MIDYLKFQNWKNFHCLEMEDLAFSKPTDIFIFVRFTQKNPINLQSRKVLFAKTSEEAIGFIRHIFLYDILNDLTDDLNNDFKKNFDIAQTDAVSVLNKWFKLGKLSNNMSFLQLKKFCRDFNLEFSIRANTEYEIQVLNGANELRRFLNKRFSDNENFDKQKLSDICSNALFVPKHLNDYLDIILN